MSPHSRRPAPAMIAIAGTGRSTFLATVSETRPSCWAARGGGATELGRLSVDDTTVLHLCTVADARRPPWPASSTSSLVGAVVVADPHRLTDALPTVSWFDACGVPFVVVLDGTGGDPDVVRATLALDPEVPVVTADCRDRTVALRALATLVGWALAGPQKAVVAAVS